MVILLLCQGTSMRNTDNVLEVRTCLTASSLIDYKYFVIDHTIDAIRGAQRAHKRQCKLLWHVGAKCRCRGQDGFE